MMALVTASVVSVAACAWFRYARQGAHSLWLRGRGARPCACARVVFAAALWLLVVVCDADAHTRAGDELLSVSCGEVGPLDCDARAIDRSVRQRPVGVYV
jgi:hypothetical protein